MNQVLPPSLSEWTIPTLFEQRVREAPDAIAVSCGAAFLTYAALNARANRAAREFRAHGAAAECRIVVSVPRSIERIVIVLGILKSGAAYVGVERGWPVEYTRSLTEDAEPVFVIASKTVAHRFAGLRWPLLEVDGRRWERPDDASDLEVSLSPDNLAYLTYTSGTTGRPKGVAMPHRGVVHLASERTHIQQSHREVMVHVAPLSFDLSAWEIWACLLNGGRLEVFPDDRDFTDLAAAADAGGVTTVLLTAGLFHALVDGTPALFGRERQIVSGGDVVSATHARRALAAGCRRFVVGYGPAESSTFSTYEVITPADEIRDPLPIGTPLDGSAIYVLDDTLHDAGPEAGELWTTGNGLARGYFNAPALTAERFRPDPFSTTAGARMYRTGDRGRVARGTTEFLGRNDSQVKIRGFRVELDAVTAFLRRCPPIADATVIVEGRTAEEKRLVAFVVPRDPHAVDEAGVIAWAASQAPAHWVPADVVFVGALPLSGNGKVDRAALARLRHPKRDTPVVVTPRNETEIGLVRLYERVLDQGPISVRDNFFACGGRSIQALALIGCIERQFGTKIPLSLVSEASLEDIAQVVRRGDATLPRHTLVLLRDGGQRPPVFWMHPAGGSSFVYFELCRLLEADRRFYGFQCPDLDATSAVLELEIGDLVDVYIREMRGACPHGPYLVAGWSMGGFLAFEAACRLRREGADVPLVAILDAGPASRVESAVPVDDAEVLLHQAHFVEPAILRELEDLPGPERLERAVRIARDHHAVPPDITVEQFRRHLAVYRRNGLAHSRYEPTPYDGAVDLFRAADAVGNGLPLTLGWDMFVRGELRVHVVPGGHDSLPYVPHVQTVAQELAACIAAAELSLAAPVAGVQS